MLYIRTSIQINLLTFRMLVVAILNLKSCIFIELNTFLINTGGLEIRRTIETIQTTEYLRKSKILGKVLEKCCHLDSSERTPSKSGVKNPQEAK